MKKLPDPVRDFLKQTGRIPLLTEEGDSEETITLINP
ncbi:sigma-70 factor domain-containing protein [Coleofasciculus sp. E1-EBD-02]